MSRWKGRGSDCALSYLINHTQGVSGRTGWSGEGWVSRQFSFRISFKGSTKDETEIVDVKVFPGSLDFLGSPLYVLGESILERRTRKRGVNSDIRPDQVPNFLILRPRINGSW